jgi:hypothetical protein
MWTIRSRLDDAVSILTHSGILDNPECFGIGYSMRTDDRDCGFVEPKTVQACRHGSFSWLRCSRHLQMVTLLRYDRFGYFVQFYAVLKLRLATGKKSDLFQS